MQIWNGLSQACPGDSVITIGNFDGVHIGHKAVLGRAVVESRARGAKSVAMTFDPPPSALHMPNPPESLTTLPGRLALMAATGLDATLVVQYTAEFAAQTPEQFVQNYLMGLDARVVVVGHDMRFGSGNVGDIDTLRRLGQVSGFDVIAVDDVGATRISSSSIRTLLAGGDVQGAAEALGRNYTVDGIVVHGDHRGRTLGFPTANLGGVETMIPADGVYAGWLVTTGERLPAAISIGTNPTFDGTDRRIEAHAIGRDDLDLYGQTVTVEFAARLRETLRFDSVNALLVQMGQDVADARNVLDRW